METWWPIAQALCLAWCIDLRDYVWVLHQNGCILPLSKITCNVEQNHCCYYYFKFITLKIIIRYWKPYNLKPRFQYSLNPENISNFRVAFFCADDRVTNCYVADSIDSTPSLLYLQNLLYRRKCFGIAARRFDFY